jgi:hypothetical protein
MLLLYSDYCLEKHANYLKEVEKMKTHVCEVATGVNINVLYAKMLQLEKDQKCVLPKGWRLIAKIRPDKTSKPSFHIDLQADKGGGSWAKAKMQTLENFPELAATFPMKIGQLLCAMEELDWGDEKDLFRSISKYDNNHSVTKLNDDLTKLLVDCERGPGIAPHFGGICVPYTNTIIDQTGTRVETGKIYIAFSGASPEQDIFFALSILETLHRLLASPYESNVTESHLDFSEFEDEEFSAIQFWLSLFGFDINAA